MKFLAILQRVIVLVYSFSLLFELCDDMDLLLVDTRLGGKCKGYNNLANFNCDREHFGKWTNILV